MNRKTVQHIAATLLLSAGILASTDVVADTAIPGGSGRVNITYNEIATTCVVLATNVNQSVNFNIDSGNPGKLDGRYKTVDTVFTLTGCADTDIDVSLQSPYTEGTNPAVGVFWNTFVPSASDYNKYKESYYRFAVSLSGSGDTVSGGFTGSAGGHLPHTVSMDGAWPVRVTPDSNNYTLTATSTIYIAPRGTGTNGIAPAMAQYTYKFTYP
ncbi:TPA: hypothetical protein I8P16_002649 [Salmonella enterica subsp. enterica serovar Napoli]|nr:hypothetical protein [Salmonella enterica subsp. enterica serovar Napoli]HBC0353900.1 hypothetical protein [Salmonella enterica subsp. enterica serovar Napoli]